MASDREAGPAPYEGAARALITVALALAVFMNVLDTSIANVSIPTIAGDLAVSSDQGTWIITSFAVSNAIAVPLSGWLAKRFGEVRLFVGCTLLFTLFSWLCGLSFTFPMLLLMRTVQGAVAGPMIPLSQSLLLANYPSGKRGLANGIWGMTAVVGPVAGPILGGWITDNMSWSWIFYINLPVGIAAALITWLMLKDRETETRRLPIDVIGLALLIVGVTCLQIMLDKGNDAGWFQSQLIVVMTILAVIALGFFTAWELTDEHPVVDLKLFRLRNFAIATTVVTVGFMVYFGGVVILPLWLQTQMGYTATWAGIATSSLGIAGIIASPIVGRLTDKVDVRIIVTVGMLIFSAISFYNAGITTQVSFSGFFLGCPGASASPASSSRSSRSRSPRIPPSLVASASGVFNFMRLIALALGTSLSQLVWDHRELLHDHRLTSNLSALDPLTREALARAQASGLSELEALKSLSDAITSQAYMLATNDIFWLSGWLFLALIVLVWLARSPAATRTRGRAEAG